MRTQVELVHHAGLIERWIRFGRWSEEQILDRRRRVVAFDPDAIFALVRWRAGTFSTVESRIDILRAVRSGEPLTTVPFVRPGGELLAHVGGWPRVERMLRAIDAVELAGVRAETAAPDYWRHAANRIAAGLEPRAYSCVRHRAWVLRRELAP